MLKCYGLPTPYARAAVEDILRTRKILLPAVVLLEIYYKTIQNRGIVVAEWRYTTLKNSKARHIAELTEPVLLKKK